MNITADTSFARKLQATEGKTIERVCANSDAPYCDATEITFFFTDGTEIVFHPTVTHQTTSERGAESAIGPHHRAKGTICHKCILWRRGYD
jgi:hypothetical protein